MKQNDLIKKMYAASLTNCKSKIAEVRQEELSHIVNKRSQGKKYFSPKWIVTDL
jgi:hypothetical protein